MEFTKANKDCSAERSCWRKGQTYAPGRISQSRKRMARRRLTDLLERWKHPCSIFTFFVFYPLSGKKNFVADHRLPPNCINLIHSHLATIADPKDNRIQKIVPECDAIDDRGLGIRSLFSQNTGQAYFSWNQPARQMAQPSRPALHQPPSSASKSLQALEIRTNLLRHESAPLRKEALVIFRPHFKNPLRNTIGYEIRG